MRKLLLLILLFPLFLSSQEEFSFELYFEDAIGNKDTLLLGFDPLATDSIDVAFGEVNIINQPWNNDFEVRAADYTLLAGDTSTWQTKKSIVFEANIGIEVNAIHFPVRMSWDYLIFQNNPEIEKSYFWMRSFTDQYELLRYSSYFDIYEETINQIYYQNDTVQTLYFSFCDTSCFMGNVNIDQYYMETLNLFPTPASNIVSIKNKTLNIEGSIYQIFNSIGQLSQSGIIQSSQIDISKLTSGYYTISLMLDNQRYHSTLVISH